MKSLFQIGAFTLHSGQRSSFKIDCDALTIPDWECLALMLVERLPPFGSVEGIPRGGLELAKALGLYITEGPHLIVDDVLTTGGSMAEARKAYWGELEALVPVLGAVVFDRSAGQCPGWITPLFTLTPPLSKEITT